MHVAFTASDLSNFYFGWRGSQAFGTTLSPGIGSTTSFALRLGSQAVGFSASSTAQRYEFLLIQRVTGGFILMRTAATGAWNLIAVERISSGSTFYPMFYNDAATASSAGVLHFLRVPVQLWTPTPIVSDSFVRADSSSIGSTDGAGDVVLGGGGFAWSEVVGDSAISSNALAVDASGGIAVVDSGQANVLVDCTLTPDATARGIAFRVSDATNFWRCTITSGGVLNISKVVNGSATSVANTTGVTTGSNQRLQVTADGNTVSAIYFGASTPTRITGSDAFNNTATKHGGYQATIANFCVWPRSIVYPYELAA